MAVSVAGELYIELDGQLSEIKRQIRLRGGYPFDPEQLKLHLQAAIEGRFSFAPVVAPPPVEKFGLLADLGVITTPADYVPVTEFAGMKFENPSQVLEPGDQLWVRVHKQIVDGTTTSEERLACLARLGSYLVGAQGIEIVYSKRSELSKDYWYSSFDEKDRLPLDAKRNHRVPGVNRYLGYDFNRDLGYFEFPWYDYRAFLSFCDPTLRPLAA